jgi:hypothetical protein
MLTAMARVRFYCLKPVVEDDADRIVLAVEAAVTLEFLVRGPTRATLTFADVPRCAGARS